MRENRTYGSARVCASNGTFYLLSTVFLLDLFIVIEAVEFAILEAALVLFRLCLSENVRQSVAEVHGADFLAFGSTYLCLVPLPVVSHTASYCEVLSVKVDVLPSQCTRFSDTKPCVIGYLHREQCRIVFLFQKVLQH